MRARSGCKEAAVQQSRVQDFMCVSLFDAIDHL